MWACDLYLCHSGRCQWSALGSGAMKSHFLLRTGYFLNWCATFNFSGLCSTFLNTDRSVTLNATSITTAYVKLRANKSVCHVVHFVARQHCDNENTFFCARQKWLKSIKRTSDLSFCETQITAAISLVKCTCAYSKQEEWSSVFELTTVTGDRCLRNPQGLVYRRLRHLQRLATDVWDVFVDLRQVFYISTKTGDTGVWVLEGVELISCSLPPERYVTNIQRRTRRRQRWSAYSPIWRTCNYIIITQALRCGVPYRTDTGCIVNSGRKTEAVLINTLFCCRVHVGCVTSSVRISKDKTDVMRLCSIFYGVCVGYEPWL